MFILFFSHIFIKKNVVAIANQLFEIKSKMKKFEYLKIERNVNRLFYELSQQGYEIVDPLGRKYLDTDISIEATVNGEITADSKVVKVLKPIIYKKENGNSQLVQKGIVIVE